MVDVISFIDQKTKKLFKVKLVLGFIQKRHDKGENRFRYMELDLPVRHMALDDSIGWIIFHCWGRRLNSLMKYEWSRSTRPETYTSASTWLSGGSHIFLPALTKPYLIQSVAQKKKKNLIQYKRNTLYLETSLFSSHVST